MKKLIIIFCIACISVSAIAQSQSGVRIGSYVFHVQKANPDSLINVYAEDNPCPPCPSENETRPQPKFNKYHRHEGFAGIGFILPDNGSGYYTTLGGNSINIDVGGIRTYHLTRRFALGNSLQYSYYNYKLKVNEPPYLEEVFKNKTFEKDDIAKQVFRSHNVALGAFTRFYLIPPKNRGKDGLFVDLGAQGDFAFSKYCMLKTESDNRKHKFRDGEAFNPFSASAIARLGWKWWRGGDNQAIFVRYRFTDAFGSKLPMDLPPITIGIQFL